VIVWLAMLAFFIASIVAAILRRAPKEFPAAPRPFTIIMPIKGVSPHLARNLSALAGLEAADEIIVAVADAHDPAYAIAAPLAAAYRGRVRFMVGEAPEFANPKLRNIAKAYRAARHDTIVFFDDTVAADAGLLGELLGRLAAGARAVTAAPIGGQTENLPAEIEAAKYNGYLLRIEAFLDLFGLAAGFGNAFAFRKSDLERAGGLMRLAEGPCEDNALSRALRGLGGRFELAHRNTIRPIGARSWRELALRHVRWKNCIKCHDPAVFLLEIWIGGLAFNVLGAVAMAEMLGAAWWAGLSASAAIWYGGELLLTVAAGWPLTWRSPPAWLLRDLLQPVFTLVAAFTREVEWRGVRIEMRWRRPARVRR